MRIAANIFFSIWASSWLTSCPISLSLSVSSVMPVFSILVNTTEQGISMSLKRASSFVCFANSGSSTFFNLIHPGKGYAQRPNQLN
jgi:hypothetical protein